jgi:hypothetical protein
MPAQPILLRVSREAVAMEALTEFVAACWQLFIQRYHYHKINKGI